MAERLIRTHLCPSLGPLLDTPDAGFIARLDGVHAVAADVDEAAADRLGAFRGEMAGMSGGERAELHAHTFELSPICVLYVSVHLFGEESFKRARLMTGLDEAYHAAGFGRGRELPDHLGVILRFAPHFSDEEWDEMVRYCLAGPVREMHASLARTSTPYRLLLEAIAGVIEREAAREATHGCV